jgi:hypothetical protein
MEIRDRALGVLGVTSVYDTEQIRRNFLRQIRLVHPDGPNRHRRNVPGYDNTEIARLLIQAYGLLTGRHTPTTMLEDDTLLGALLDGHITPMAETVSYDQWQADRFYDQFRHSVWPEPPVSEDESRKRFRGI